MNKPVINEIHQNDLLDFANKNDAVDENVNVHRDRENGGLLGSLYFFLQSITNIVFFVRSSLLFD
jgi:hypothetical protein